MFLKQKDRHAALLERLDSVNGKLDRVLASIADTDKKLDAVREALLESGATNPEKLMEEGIANLMSYDGTFKGMK